MLNQTSPTMQMTLKLPEIISADFCQKNLKEKKSIFLKEKKDFH